MGVDPGTHSIAVAVLSPAGEGRPPILVDAKVLRPPCDPKTELHERATATCRGAYQLGHLMVKHEPITVLVEGQHHFDSKKDVTDTILLAAVAGACISAAAACWKAQGPYARVRYLKPGEWSKMEKGMRHARLEDIYFKGSITKAKVKEFAGEITKREYGDMLDAIGMAYWEMIGRPRAGI